MHGCVGYIFFLVCIYSYVATYDLRVDQYFCVYISIAKQSGSQAKSPSSGITVYTYTIIYSYTYVYIENVILRMYYFLPYILMTDHFW